MRWQDMPASANVEDLRSQGPQTGNLQASYFPWELNDWPWNARQRWLRQNMPANLPTTPLADQNTPAFVKPGSDETGHWRQNGDGGWVFTSGPMGGDVQSGAPQLASPFPGPLGTGDPAGWSYLFGGR